MNLDDLSRAEFAFPDPLRDQLVAAILCGSATWTWGTFSTRVRVNESVAQWRAGHECLWHSPQVRAGLGDPGFTVNDDTLVLAQRFRLVHVAEDA